MAVVQLTDAIIPAVYMSYTSVNSPELSAFWQSGVVAHNSLLDTIAQGPAKSAEMPFWQDLDSTVEPDRSNDDPSIISVPGKVQASEMKARKAFLNKSYSAMDLVGELAGSNPMQRIRDRFGTYWKRQWQRRLIATCVGITADNVANDGSDMTVNISIADGAAAQPSNLFSRTSFIDAQFTMGDHFDDFVAIAVHSMVRKRMDENNEIAYLRDSDNNLISASYMGKQIIVDDQLAPVAGGTSGFVYTSILFGAGAFGYGEGSPLVPVETLRVPGAGNGAGQETIWERNTWLLHPFGYDWTDTTVTANANSGDGVSATLADLRLAVNWNRKIDRKLIPLAFLKTNG